MRRLIPVLLLVVAGCAPAQTPVPSPSAAAANPSPVATPSASPAPGSLVFAALEADGAAGPTEWNTVAIAGVDGKARARATFLPMPIPNVGCLAALLPQSAHVAAGKVYFADGAGVVRSLSVDGQVVQVARFPFGPQQKMLSFAVSPDGSRLLGAVFTLPAKPHLACSGPSVAGVYSLDVYSATAGGASKLLYHQSRSNINVMALVGWDSIGPIGTYPTAWATEGGPPRAYEGGIPVRVGAGTGKILNQVAVPNGPALAPSATLCQVWDMRPTGDFTCVPPPGSSASVRRPDGHQIWRARNLAGPEYYYFLSPDEKHVMEMGAGGLQVFGTDGITINLAGSLFPEGWLDSSTVIGTPIDNAGRGNLSSIRLTDPSTVVDLGFKGLFVGTLRN